METDSQILSPDSHVSLLPSNPIFIQACLLLRSYQKSGDCIIGSSDVCSIFSISAIEVAILAGTIGALAARKRVELVLRATRMWNLHRGTRRYI